MIIVICLCFAQLSAPADYLKIVVGYVCVVLGQALFLVGLETSILPIGRMVGGSFAKYNNLIFVLCFGFVFGLLATVAEPALSVLAKQISSIMPLVNSTLFIWITGTGIGIGVARAFAYREEYQYQVAVRHSLRACVRAGYLFAQRVYRPCVRR